MWDARKDKIECCNISFHKGQTGQNQISNSSSNNPKQTTGTKAEKDSRSANEDFPRHNGTKRRICRFYINIGDWSSFFRPFLKKTGDDFSAVDERLCRVWQRDVIRSVPKSWWKTRTSKTVCHNKFSQIEIYSKVHLTAMPVKSTNEKLWINESRLFLNFQCCSLVYSC